MLVEQLRGLHAEVASLSSLVVRLRAQHSAAAAAAAGRPGAGLGAAEHWLRPQALWSGTSDGTAPGGGGGGWPSPHPGYVWAVATVRSRSWDEHID
jgi:hypothetical protein